MGNTFSFIPYVCYFSYHPWITAFEERSLINSTSTFTSLSNSARVPSLLPSPL